MQPKASSTAFKGKKWVLFSFFNARRRVGKKTGLKFIFPCGEISFLIEEKKDERKFVDSTLPESSSA